MTTYQEDRILNELKGAKRVASMEMHEFCDILMTRLRNEFGLNVLGHEKAMDALYDVETAFTDLGAATEVESSLNGTKTYESGEVPESLSATQAESAQAMATLMAEWRKIGFSTSDITALTDDIKQYTVLLKNYGAARMAIAIVSPMDDCV